MSALLPCPCGHKRPPVTWRAGKSYRYRYRCLRCGLEAKVAATLNEPHQLERYWNEAVQIYRVAREEAPRG
jgi:hypothetical protein